MKRKITLCILAISITILICIGITYAYFSANVALNNQTETVIKSNELTLTFNGTSEINCSNLIPGESCTKTFNVKNDSNRAVTYNIYMQNITNEFNEDLVYTLTDETGEVVAETKAPDTNIEKTYILSDIEIGATSTKNYTLKVEFKYLATPQNDNQGASFKATVGIDANKVENSNNPVANTLCKRATALHTEECSQTDTSWYCSGDGYTADGTMGTTTITYGNLGTSGTLASGDAFDCDVNGDGTYDAETERFYYVSDMTNGVTTDSNTAVLIYYNNVSGGEPSNSTTYNYYNSMYVSNKYYGPVTAKEQLPTTTQWSNVSLTSTTRDITDEASTIRVSKFSYEGYAARLLTTQELESGCGFTVGSNTIGELSNKCQLLMENTRYSNKSLGTYGPLLESPDSSRTTASWAISAYSRIVGSGSGGDYGVRPAIEVPKSRIEI